jgi:uncharacterized membrane protein
MLRSLTFGIACAIALHAVDAQAKGWRVCNQTTEHLLVAIAYTDAQDRTISRGWYSINACRGCVKVMDHSWTPYEHVYLHAKNASGEVRFGDRFRWCVTSGKFTVVNGRQCGGTFRSAPFSLQTIRSDAGDYITRLNPAGGRPVCID